MSVKPTIAKARTAIAVKEKAIEKLGRMPSASVQITRNNFSLLQQKIFASLVYAVTTKIAKKPRLNAAELDELRVFHWRVDLKQLRELSKFNSNDYDLFRRSIDALVDLSVSFNLLGKDKDEIVVCPECGAYMNELNEGLICPLCGHMAERKARAAVKAISGKSNIVDAVIYKDGDLYFSFANLVNYYLEKSETRLYCKFLPKKLNSLKRGSSHAIYLLLLDYIDEKRGEGQTPFMDVETFAKLVGGETYQKDYGGLRKRCIEPAIDEINKHTDIEILFDPYEDLKYKGRKVTEIRLRGEYKKDDGNNKGKQSKRDKRSKSLFDNDELDDNEQNNTLTLFGYTIDKDSFLDFLSMGATKNKSAYKQAMRKALNEGTLGDMKERVSKYISFKLEQEKIIEAEREQEKANEFYKRLTDIAIKEKQSKIEELTVFTENYGFVSVNRFIDDNKLIELAEQLNVNGSDKQVSKRLYTTKEREAYEAKEYDLYQKTIVKPLTDVSPMDSWFVIIDGQETKMFYSAIIRAIGKTAILGTMRKIERLLKQGVNVEFRADNRLYTASFNSEKVMVLAKTNDTEIDKLNDVGSDNEIIDEISDNETATTLNDNSKTIALINDNAIGLVNASKTNNASDNNSLASTNVASNSSETTSAYETEDSAFNPFSKAQTRITSINDGNIISATRRE